MHKYGKIENLYKFDPETNGRLDVFTDPVFEYLAGADWHLTEKIDGTNIRLIFDNDGRMEIRGRSDKAQLDGELVENIERQMHGVLKMYNKTIYGEGCGEGIQKGGRYGKKHFVAFDLCDHKYGRGWFWPRQEAFELFDAYGIRRVPTVAQPLHLDSNLWAAYDLVQEGLISQYAGDGELAEGIVAVPMADIIDGFMERIIVKIKTRDYYGKQLVPHIG